MVGTGHWLPPSTSREPPPPQLLLLPCRHAIAAQGPTPPPPPSPSVTLTVLSLVALLFCATFEMDLEALKGGAYGPAPPAVGK